MRSDTATPSTTGANAPPPDAAPSTAEHRRIGKDARGERAWKRWEPYLNERQWEDVKEVYYYLDATPTSSYLEMLYKYPQGEFPYARLVDEGRRRGRDHPDLGSYVLHCDGDATLLFCDNDTNAGRLFGSATPGHFRDAFHCIPLALVDASFAKAQLVLLAREWYMHRTASCRRTSGASAT